jgi:hypothetical protein
MKLCVNLKETKTQFKALSRDKFSFTDAIIMSHSNSLHHLSGDPRNGGEGQRLGPGRRRICDFASVAAVAPACRSFSSRRSSACTVSPALPAIPATEGRGAWLCSGRRRCLRSLQNLEPPLLSLHHLSQRSPRRRGVAATSPQQALCWCGRCKTGYLVCTLTDTTNA